MFLYSFIFPIISIIAILWFFARYKRRKNSLATFIAWTILWIFVILFSLLPDVSNLFASLFGITRGLDFIIIVVFVVLFYTILKLYFKLDKLQDDVNKIVKEVALNNEITLDDKEDE